MQKARKALVTGGAGFVGSNLCEFLLDKGLDVICLDNLITGHKNNISHLLKNKKFKFIKADITKSIPVKEKVDWIFNLACPASPIWYRKFPIETMKVSTIGVINVLDFAKKNKARVLHTSTSEVYGDPLEHPQKESYWGHVNPNGLRSCYDEGKRAAESILMDYKREYGVEVRIIRIFNTYGPKMSPNDGRVVSSFIMEALSGKSISIFGDGSQTRSFQYISDLIEGMWLMMNKENFVGPVNIGNPSEFTVLELAKKVMSKLGSKKEIVFEPLPSDDPTKRRPDISLAKKELNWTPKVSLDEGLDKTIEYFRKIL